MLDTHATIRSSRTGFGPGSPGPRLYSTRVCIRSVNDGELTTHTNVQGSVREVPRVSSPMAPMSRDVGWIY